MNFLKKIDHYLLTNYPVIWRTKLHYFVLFSLILGTLATYGLGYFLIKWFGAIDLRFLYLGIVVLNIFVVIFWLITQARHKIKYYKFGDELLTISIYMFCTASLFVHPILFGKTYVRTTANLVSIEQIDIDIKKVNSRYGGVYLKPIQFDFVYPSYDTVIELAERYQVNTSFDKKDIPLIGHKISRKVDRIYLSQPRYENKNLLDYICTTHRIHVDWTPILVFLFIPILLFLMSHTDFRMTLKIVIAYGFLVMISGVFATFKPGVFPFIVLLLLCAFTMFGQEKTSRFASLLMIPYSSVVCFLSIALVMDSTDISYYYPSIFSVALNLIVTVVVTILSSTFFIKKHFEPAT